MFYGYIISAVAPAIVLMIYIYRLDRIEKEPTSLLVKLFFLGFVAALLSLILEVVFDMVMGGVIASFSLVVTSICSALSVGVIEESCKYLCLKKGSWKNRAFNYRFDGVVYAVFVSLGFAALENIFYVLQYQDVSTIVMRALLSIPAHMSFGIYMGLYYGRARILERNGRTSLSKKNRIIGLLSAILFHTIYDACLMIHTNISFLCFIVVVLFMYFYVFKMVKVESIHDSCI